jgi:hypothetical protein
MANWDINRLFSGDMFRDIISPATIEVSTTLWFRRRYRKCEETGVPVFDRLFVSTMGGTNLVANQRRTSPYARPRYWQHDLSEMAAVPNS